MIESEREREKDEKRFDPEVPPTPYAQRYHFAVNSGDVFDLEAEGIALPGNVIRGLGEYAQGKGPARALYVKATDLQLATAEDIASAAYELQRQNETLNSSELDVLVSELQHIARTGGLDDDFDPSTSVLEFDLTEKELESLRYIAARYDSASILLDAYDEETKTIPRSAVHAAFRATAHDGGDVGTVPLAGGKLEEKIFQLWGESEADEYAFEPPYDPMYDEEET